MRPESYPVGVEQIAESLKTSVDAIIRQPAGSYTLDDILAELRKPGRDPRDKFVAPKFHEEVRTIDDVQTGMVLEGVVTNVTKFGAFVDVGVHQDGLVHISELSNRYTKDLPRPSQSRRDCESESVECGYQVETHVFSIKALSAPASKPAPTRDMPPSPTLSDKFVTLSTKLRAHA